MKSIVSSCAISSLVKKNVVGERKRNRETERYKRDIERHRFKKTETETERKRERHEERESEPDTWLEVHIKSESLYNMKIVLRIV